MKMGGLPHVPDVRALEQHLARQEGPLAQRLFVLLRLRGRGRAIVAVWCALLPGALTPRLRAVPLAPAVLGAVRMALSRGVGPVIAVIASALLLFVQHGVPSSLAEQHCDLEPLCDADAAGHVRGQHKVDDVPPQVGPVARQQRVREVQGRHAHEVEGRRQMVVLQGAAVVEVDGQRVRVRDEVRVVHARVAGVMDDGRNHEGEQLDARHLQRPLAAEAAEKPVARGQHIRSVGRKVVRDKRVVAALDGADKELKPLPVRPSDLAQSKLAK
mmetsp:Transcript_9746/g.37935  ORF Transcript_9746/g.37935 Transcript_9746/m.37935 type:complete len:271 (+) Transcript_9746:1226-2038(+)